MTANGAEKHENINPYDNSDAIEHVAKLAARCEDGDIRNALLNYGIMLERVSVLLAHENMFIPTDSVREVLLGRTPYLLVRQLGYDDYILAAQQSGRK